MTQTDVRPHHRLGIAHAAATGAAVLLFLFILFWASAASGAMPHLRVLFGPMGAGSPMALLIMAIYALALGAIVGLMVAIFYNLFRFLSPARGAHG